METRVAVMGIIVEDEATVEALNATLHESIAPTARTASACLVP